MFGMDIIDLQEVSIHGGTLRYYIGRKNVHEKNDRVNEFIDLEKRRNVHEIDSLREFAKAVHKHRDDLTWMLKSIKREGKRIAGVSAPAKGMTLLNYCKIGPETLDFLTEKSPLKIGKYAPGTHLPVVDDARLIEEMPDYALLLAWNFADEIMKNLSDYREKGGKFIIPIPSPQIVE